MQNPVTKMQNLKIKKLKNEDSENLGAQLFLVIGNLFILTYCYVCYVILKLGSQIIVM